MTTKEYNGHTIELTDEWRFRISGPLVTDQVQQWAESAAVAREKIDMLVKQDAATRRVRLSIPVLLEGGIEKTVTGVHGRHLKALGIDNADYMWPVHPRIRDLLKERRVLNDRLRKIGETLNRYMVRTMPGLYAREHSKVVENLQKRIAEATERANAELKDETATA